MEWTEADVPESRFLTAPHPFPATSWSLVARSMERVDPAKPGAPDAPDAQKALDRLVRRYWRPVFYFVYRNSGRDVDRAKDLTQEFFAALIEKGTLEGAEEGRGRFRNFVLVLVRRFLTKARRSEGAQKRGPGRGLLSIEGLKEAHGAFDVPDPKGGDPDAGFDDDWRRAVIEAALGELRLRASQAGKAGLVDLLVRRDLEPGGAAPPTYEDLAKSSGLTLHQVTNGLHWARREFKRLVLEEIGDQVSSRDELAAEARELFGLDPP